MVQQITTVGKACEGIDRGLADGQIFGLLLRLQRRQHLGAELDAASHSPQQRALFQGVSLPKTSHHHHVPTIQRGPVEMQGHSCKAEHRQPLLHRRRQQELLMILKTDAVLKVGLGAIHDGRDLRIHALRHPAHHVPQGRGAPNGEGRQDLRKHMQRPWRRAHASAKATTVWLCKPPEPSVRAISP